MRGVEHAQLCVVTTVTETIVVTCVAKLLQQLGRVDGKAVGLVQLAQAVHALYLLLLCKPLLLARLCAVLGEEE